MKRPEEITENKNPASGGSRSWHALGMALATGFLLTGCDTAFLATYYLAAGTAQTVSKAFEPPPPSVHVPGEQVPVFYRLDEHRFFSAFVFSDDQRAYENDPLPASLSYRDEQLQGSAKEPTHTGRRFWLSIATFDLDAAETRYLVAPSIAKESTNEPGLLVFSQDGGKSWHRLMDDRCPAPMAPIVPIKGGRPLVIPESLTFTQRGSLLYFDNQTKVIDLAQPYVVTQNPTYHYRQACLTWRAVTPDEVTAPVKPALGSPEPVIRNG